MAIKHSVDPLSPTYAFEVGVGIYNGDVVVKNFSIIRLKLYPYTTRFRIEIEACNRTAKIIKTAISAVKSR